MVALWYNILISFRNLSKNKYYLILNIAGITTALICSFLIYLWISDELSYDKFFKDYKNIYRVIVLSKENQTAVKSIGTPKDLSTALKLNFPEIKEVTIYDRQSHSYFKWNDNSVNVVVRFTDRNFFKVFDFEFKEGNAEKAFDASNPVIITTRLARILFGNKPALGETVISMFDNKYTVTGVVNLPENSHFDFDALELSNLIDEKSNSTYVKFATGTKFSNEKKIKLSQVAALQTKSNVRLNFQPLSEIYLNNSIEETGNLKPHGSFQNILFIAIIAFIIILIAGFNYLNLSTAQSLNRLREVGIKKVIGSLKSQIITGFMAEFLLISIVAFLLAFYFAGLLIPVFNQVTGKHLYIQLHAGLLIFSFLIVLLTGLISVCYPAFYTASLPPERIFKRKIKTNSRSILQKTFIVAQFSISLFIIIVTLFFNKQLNYINNKSLGFEKANLISMPTSEFIYSYQELRERLLKNPNILEVSASASSLGSNYNWTENCNWEGKNTDDTVKMCVFPVDPYYLKTTGLNMVKGEFFSEDLLKVGWFKGWDSTYTWPVVINETAAKLMGFDDPIGKRINNSRIMGVIKDYHFQPLTEQIKPLILTYNEEAFMMLNIRIRPENKKFTIAFIEKTSEPFRGNEPFHYSFFEDEIAKEYQAEKRVTRLFNLGSIISIILALSGVLGLISYLTESRRKEISLRKINGAQSTDITKMFLLEFAKISGLAFLVGAISSWLFLNYWLNNFAYKTSLSIWIFIACGIALLLLTSLTIFYQSYKIAQENPVDNLKYE